MSKNVSKIGCYIAWRVFAEPVTISGDVYMLTNFRLWDQHYNLFSMNSTCVVSLVVFCNTLTKQLDVINSDWKAIMLNCECLSDLTLLVMPV